MAGRLQVPPSFLEGLLQGLIDLMPRNEGAVGYNTGRLLAQISII